MHSFCLLTKVPAPKPSIMGTSKESIPEPGMQFSGRALAHQSCRRAWAHLINPIYQKVQCPLLPRLWSLTLGSICFWLIGQGECLSFPHLQRILQPGQRLYTEGEATTYSALWWGLVEICGPALPVGSVPVLTERFDDTNLGCDP